MTAGQSRTRWSRSGRPTQAAAIATRSTTGRVRSTRTSRATAGSLTDANGHYRFTTIRPGIYPWGNHPNAWRPAHIHFSLFGRAFTQRLVTQMYFPDDPMLDRDPILISIPDPKAGRQRLISAYDHDATVESWALGYAFDIVLRGRDATPSRAITMTERLPPDPIADGRARS